MVQIDISIEGFNGLDKRLKEIRDNIASEPGLTLKRMANDGLLFALMQAPMRTGALRSNLKMGGNKNSYWLRQDPVMGADHSEYPWMIDLGKVSPRWGTIGGRGVIDTRSREDKLYYFVGDKGHKGKTLKFLEDRFPNEVVNLGNRILIK